MSFKKVNSFFFLKNNLFTYFIFILQKKGLNTGLEKGLVYEAEKFGELSQTNVSKSLISIFFNSTQLKKNRFGNPKQPAKSVAVLGAGLMGAGVVQVSAQRGLFLRLNSIIMLINFVFIN